MLSAAEQLRDYLLNDPGVKSCVGAEVYGERGISVWELALGEPCVVVSPPASFEPRNSLAVCFRHGNRDSDLLKLLAALMEAIGKLPLAEVLECVIHTENGDRTGRISVMPGICCEDAPCPA